jgi:glycosyltransferase involved in cell wall biosynthesis
MILGTDLSNINNVNNHKMKSSNICFVSKEYAHSSMGKTGGIGVFVKNMSKELSKKKFNVYIFSFGPKKKQFIDNGVTVCVVRDLHFFISKILKFWKRHGLQGYYLLKLILEFINKLYISIKLTIFSFSNKIKIMEFNDYGGDVPFFFGFSKKIIRCHGSSTILNLFFGYGKRTIDSFFEKLLFSRYQKNIIAVSEYSSKITQQTFKLKSNIRVIYNGVNVPKRANNNEIDQSLFYVGSLMERKGIFLACEVFNQIIEINAKATFHLLGNNVNDCWNKRVVKLLSPKALINTTYYGTVVSNEVLSYVSKAHVVIFPSYGETLSIALLEAMSIGKLVVTSNIPAFREIIDHGKNGIIANSLQDYIYTISKMFLGTYENSILKENAYETIATKFNQERIVLENINYYNSII